MDFGARGIDDLDRGCNHYPVSPGNGPVQKDKAPGGSLKCWQGKVGNPGQGKKRVAVREKGRNGKGGQSGRGNSKDIQKGRVLIVVEKSRGRGSKATKLGEGGGGKTSDMEERISSHGRRSMAVKGGRTESGR